MEEESMKWLPLRFDQDGLQAGGGDRESWFLGVEYWMLGGYCGQSRAEQSRAMERL